jgi:hypothetical protein
MTPATVTLPHDARIKLCPVKKMQIVLPAFLARLPYAREPGALVRRFVTPQDGVSSVFEIEFWQQFKTYAFILPP